MTDFEATFRAMLNGAQTALNGGDAADGERRAKAVTALIRAERDVAEFLNEARAANSEHDEDVIREDLQRRLTLFAAASASGHPPEALARIAATGAA